MNMTNLFRLEGITFPSLGNRNTTSRNLLEIDNLHIPKPDLTAEGVCRSIKEASLMQPCNMFSPRYDSFVMTFLNDYMTA